MRRWTMPVGLLLLVTFFGSLSAADWPQWRGPKADGHSGEVGVKAALCAKGGPKLAWTFKDAGNGCSTPSILGDRAYVLGNRKGVDQVIALDVKTGKELWTTPIGPTYATKNPWVHGPNSAPCVEADRLYALSSAGVLICVDTTGGKQVWKKELPRALAAMVTDVGGGGAVGPFAWGFSWSPVLDGDHLIITPGGQKGLIAALDKKTGDTIWQSKLVVTDCTYASVVVADILGVHQYVAMTQDGVVSVDAKTGKQLWMYKRVNPFADMVCTTPIVAGNKVVITAHDSGMEILQIEKMGAGFVAGPAHPLIKLFSNINGGVILKDGFIYGAHQERDWKCLNLATGKIAWKDDSVGYGSICYVDGVFIFQSQNDDSVAIVAANPKMFTQLGGWKLPAKSALRFANTKFWTPPVVAAGKLFLRDQELLFCYELK